MKTLEITTKIGCKIRCLTYCPQEILNARYSGEKNLSFSAFRRLISSIPPEVDLIFAGMSEPFGNREAIDMMEYASSKGHELMLLTTLDGLDIEDAQRLIKLPFKTIVVHLPDSEGIAHITTSQDYRDVFFLIIEHIKNIQFMNMGGLFQSNKTEDYFRGKSMRQKKGRVICSKHENTEYYMMPNGDVYFCCQMKGLINKIGSLYETSYSDLLLKFKDESDQLQYDPHSICHYCTISDYWWIYKCIKIMQLMKRKVETML